MNQIYKIKKSFLIPFLLMVVFLLVLLVFSLASGAVWEKVLVALLFVVSLAVAVESYERQFTFSENNLSIRKFFRTKNFTWNEITHLGFVVMRNKVYFLLTTTNGFYILSNMLQDHTQLVRSLADKLGDEKVEPEVKNYLAAPIERKAMVVIIWVVLVILVAIIINKIVRF